MGDFTISNELSEAFQKCGFDFVVLKNATPEQFFDAIGKAKEINPHGAFVTQHSIEEYKEMPHLFLTLDNSAGIAITQDNNIVSIFNGGERRGILKTLLPVAIENGGRKLDNYSSDKLSALYELYGFNPISKVEFDRNYAPDDWNYERDGCPDVVFWIHNGDSAPDVVFNFGKYLVYWNDVKAFPTYDDAMRYRDEVIDLIDKMEDE